MTDPIVGKKVGEVVPETEFGIVSVSILQMFHSPDGFRSLNTGFQPVDSLLKEGEFFAISISN